MNNNRDLLVLHNSASFDNSQLDYEVNLLHNILIEVEDIEHFSNAHEIIDINKYRIVTSSKKIQKIICSNTLKAFCFLSCKN